MPEYQELLRFLASNPPHLEPEKKIHASLLEMLAKKLRGEAVNFGVEALNKTSALPNIKKGYH
jgi:hypothetical protein